MFTISISVSNFLHSDDVKRHVQSVHWTHDKIGSRLSRPPGFETNAKISYSISSHRWIVLKWVIIASASQRVMQCWFYFYDLVVGCNHRKWQYSFFLFNQPWWMSKLQPLSICSNMWIYSPEIRKEGSSQINISIIIQCTLLSISINCLLTRNAILSSFQAYFVSNIHYVHLELANLPPKVNSTACSTSVTGLRGAQ